MTPSSDSSKNITAKVRVPEPYVVQVVFRIGIDMPLFYGETTIEEAGRRVDDWRDHDPTVCNLIFRDYPDKRVRTSSDYREGMLAGMAHWPQPQGEND